MSESPVQSNLELATCTRLYPLEPKASGQVESLTSYLVRLAEAHGVSTGALVITEYAPAFTRKVMDKHGHCDVVGKYGSALNGLGDFAVEGARILEGLTTCANLDRLTLVPHRDLISPRSSVRMRATWCPKCFADWHDANTKIYSPLIWQLSPVDACPIHQDTRLVGVCPHCRRQHFPLSRHALPGHCPRCEKWLGAGASNDPCPTRIERLISAEANGLIEAAAVGNCRPSRLVFSMNLRFIQDHLYKGSLLRFAKDAGLNDSSLLDLVAGRSMPGLDTVLRCSVTSQVPAPKLVGQALQVSDLPTVDAWKPMAFPRRKCRAYHWDEVREMIVRATKAAEPSSLKSLCKGAGLDPGLVASKLPSEAHALIARAKAERSAQKKKRFEQAKLDIHKAVCRCFDEKKRLCHKRMRHLLRIPGCLRNPELRAHRDKLVRLAQRGELPKAGSGPLK